MKSLEIVYMMEIDVLFIIYAFIKSNDLSYMSMLGLIIVNMHFKD